MNFIHVSRKKLEYQRFGEPQSGVPTLLFLHEGLGSLSQWRDFPERLSFNTGYPAIAYSRAGYGHSDSAELPRSIDFMHREAIEVVPKFLEKMKERDVILIGHSDGGSIALLYASKPTVRVRALLLEAPHVFVEDVTVSSIAQAREDYLRGEMKKRLAKYHPRTDETFLGWSDIWLQPQFRFWNIEKVLPDIKMPVLVLQGEEDRFGTVRQVESIQRGCSGRVEVSLIPECGHHPHLEKPQETLSLMTDFIRRL